MCEYTQKIQDKITLYIFYNGMLGKTKIFDDHQHWPRYSGSGSTYRIQIAEQGIQVPYETAYMAHWQANHHSN